MSVLPSQFGDSAGCSFLEAGSLAVIIKAWASSIADRQDGDSRRSFPRTSPPSPGRREESSVCSLWFSRKALNFGLVGLVLSGS